ncbi:MAG: alpha/beta fold hydrolase [Erysipelotrichaceae bacterium]|nr:alpha/beta fold hydrolase [Erysipelotrichaceae bacterium]
MKEFYIDSDGIKLHAKLEMPEVQGKCPLAIVIHGLTGHMEEPHIIAAAKTFRDNGIATLRVEMYGHGKSGGDFGKHTLFKWINNALDVVDYAKTLDFVTDLYLCGHSQGGLLTMIIGGLRNDDFRAIVPMSPAAVILDAAKKGNFFGIPFDPKHIPDRFSFNGVDFSGNYFRVAQMIHLAELIDRYTGKVLLIHGDEDEAVPLLYSIEADKRYTDSKLVIIKGDDHCYTRHLDEMTAALDAFLKELK